MRKLHAFTSHSISSPAEIHPVVIKGGSEVTTVTPLSEAQSNESMVLGVSINNSYHKITRRIHDWLNSLQVKVEFS